MQNDNLKNLEQLMKDPGINKNNSGYDLSLLDDPNYKKEKAKEKAKSNGKSSNWGNDFALGVAQGAVNFPKKVVKFAEKLSDVVLPEDIQNIQHKYGLTSENIPSAHFAPNTASSEIGEAVGETAASMLMPEIGAPTKIAEALKAGKLATAAIKGGMSGAIGAGILDDNQPLSVSMPLGAIFGAIAAPALDLAIPWLLTSKGSPINLIQQAKPIIAKAASDIREKLSHGVSDENLRDEIFKIANDEFDRISDSFSIYDQAAETGQTLLSRNKAAYDNSAIKSAVKHAAKVLYADLDLLAVPEDEIKNIVNSLYRNFSPDNVNVESYYQAIALKQKTNSLSKALTRDAGKLTGWWERKKALGIIKDSIYKSMTDSAKGNTIVEEMVKKADDAYRRFIDTYYDSFYGKDMSLPELKSKFLSSYVKKGAQNDAYEMIQKLFNLLPNKDSREMVAAWALKEAKTPSDMLKEYNKYGDKQKSLLFGQMKNELDKLNLLANKHPAIFKDEIPLFDKFKNHLLGAGILGAGGVSYFTGHPLLAATSLIPYAGKAMAHGISKLNPELPRKAFEMVPEYGKNFKKAKAAIYGVESLLDILQR